MSETDQILESTYERRARQLVKKGRAFWIDDGKICLTSDSVLKEDTVMDSTYEADRQNGGGYRVADTFETSRFYDEETLFKMAKRKLADKRGMIIHAASYVVVNLFMILFMGALAISGEINFGEAMITIIGVLGGWGIGLAMHIVTHFTRATPEKIEMEYQRLKGMTKRD